LCPPPPLAPCPLEALPADEETLVPEETAAVEEETELVLVDIAPEYPLEVCDIPVYAPVPPPKPPPPVLKTGGRGT
jgi:hypothetical protein